MLGYYTTYEKLERFRFLVDGAHYGIYKIPDFLFKFVTH